MSSENTLDDVFPPWNEGSFDTPTAFSDKFQSTTVWRHVPGAPQPLSRPQIAPRWHRRLWSIRLKWRFGVDTIKAQFAAAELPKTRQSRCRCHENEAADSPGDHLTD